MRQPLFWMAAFAEQSRACLARSSRMVTGLCDPLLWSASGCGALDVCCCCVAVLAKAEKVVILFYIRAQFKISSVSLKFDLRFEQPVRRNVFAASPKQHLSSTLEELLTVHPTQLVSLAITLAHFGALCALRVTLHERVCTQVGVTRSARVLFLGDTVAATPRCDQMVQ